MTKRELLELIRTTIKEYTGTGSSGGNAGDGNNITSPRPFVDDEDEKENYKDKGAPFGGAEGQHTRGMGKSGTINYNRPGAQSSGGPRFESKKLSENFDDRLKAKMGMSDDEFEKNVTSRDIEAPFPGTDNVSPFVAKAKDYIEKFRQEYREMSDDGIDEFSKEMIEHFLDNTAAQAAAKIWFGKKEL